MNEPQRQYHKRYRQDHCDSIKAKKRIYRKKNAEAINALNRAYRKMNPEEVRAYGKRWRQSKPWYQTFMMARQRARAAGLLHPNHDKAKIVELFVLAKDLTKSTGVNHAVDHIIPARYGGWFHELNLGVMPQSVNSSKGEDPIWEEPGFRSWRNVPEFLWPDRLVPVYRALRGQVTP